MGNSNSAWVEQAMLTYKTEHMKYGLSYTRKQNGARLTGTIKVTAKTWEDKATE